MRTLWKPEEHLRGNGEPFTMFAEPAVRELLEAMERGEVTLDEAFDACMYAIQRQEDGEYDAVFLTEMKQGIRMAKESR